MFLRIPQSFHFSEQNSIGTSCILTADTHVTTKLPKNPVRVITPKAKPPGVTDYDEKHFSCFSGAARGNFTHRLFRMEAGGDCGFGLNVFINQKPRDGSPAQEQRATSHQGSST